MKYTQLILLSCGLDSATLATKLVKQDNLDCLRGLYIDLGFPASPREKASVRKLCFEHGIPLEVVSLSGILDMITGFVPIELLDELDKGQPTPIPLTDGDTTSDYVSGFSILLSVATHYAQLAQLETLYVALTKEQFTYNTALEKFLQSWSDMHTSLNPRRPIQLQSPFKETTKNEIINLGYELGVNYAQTWSCYRGANLHCGECDGCLSRRTGFEKSNHPDPTSYLLA